MLVIAEVTYLLQREAGPRVELRFIADLVEGTYEPIVGGAESIGSRIAELVWRYRDMPLGTVDASVIAVAERLKVKQIATLDHRHFSVVKPAHVEAFELLP